MSSSASTSAPDFPPPRRRAPVLVLGTFALVLAGSITCSLLFFTAGLLLAPFVIGAAVIYLFASNPPRGGKGSGVGPSPGPGAQV